MRLMFWLATVSALVFVTTAVTVVYGQDPNQAPVPAQQQQQESSQPVTAAPQVPALQAAQPFNLVEQKQAGPDLLRRMKTRVSVDFRDAPIEDVIKSLAQQADIDIVKGPNVTGTVTATLTDVPLDEAMESIFTVHGFGYTTSESIVRIVLKSEMAQYMVKLQTKVYHVDYADIEMLDKAIKDMLSPQGKIAVNKETRHLCVTDTDAQIRMFDSVIEQMDQETPQILVEARIYDVSCSVNLDLGFDWSAGTITVYDTATGEVIGGRTDPYASGQFSSNITTALKTTSTLNFGILNDHVNLDTMFKAAQEDIKSKLLANPKILVLSGEQADIKIVQEYPYQELTQTAEGGNMGTTKFKEIGTELLVTPQLARDGKIRLMIKPSFGARTDTVDLVVPTGLTGSITIPQPVVDKREAETVALIRDGQTVVIGGLRKRDIIQKISKVPLLGDIPLLGELFKFRGETTANSELIVFITPHIVTEPSLASSDTSKLEGMEADLREPSPAKPLVDCGTCTSRQEEREQ
jgi:type IV pilus assembly protein PilQ